MAGCELNKNLHNPISCSSCFAAQPSFPPASSSSSASSVRAGRGPERKSGERAESPRIPKSRRIPGSPGAKEVRQEIQGKELKRQAGRHTCSRRRGFREDTATAIGSCGHPGSCPPKL